MAKAKKQAGSNEAAEAGEKKVDEKKPAAAKPAAKGKKKPAMAAASAPAEPMIDTNLAAAIAAKRLAHRDELAAAEHAPTGESAQFKQLKESLHKPAGGNVPSFLQAHDPNKKFNSGIGGRNQQLGRNQTFGADVNRTGVPRRTGG